VLSALSTWANQLVIDRPEIQRIGCIGSYAREDAGPGSDLDLVIILKDSDQPFMDRAAAFDTTSLPVPTDLLVYTAEEFERVTGEPTRFARVLLEEAHWVY
jgi:predicted nucleotidyltransferase